MQDMLDRWMPQAASMNRNPPRSRSAGPRKREVLDRQVLDQLSALLKPERLARAINFYLVESPKLIQKLKQAAAPMTRRDRALRSFAQIEQRKPRRERVEPVLRGHRGVGAPR